MGRDKTGRLTTGTGPLFLREMGLWCTVYVLVLIEFTVKIGHRPMVQRGVPGTPNQ